MNLLINGESRNVEKVTSIESLLVAFNLQHKIMVIEVNRNIIDRTLYDTTFLHDGDAVEIVHFVGGG